MQDSEEDIFKARVFAEHDENIASISHRSRDACTDPHKIKAVRISSWVGGGNLSDKLLEIDGC